MGKVWVRIPAPAPLKDPKPDLPTLPGQLSHVTKVHMSNPAREGGRDPGYVLLRLGLRGCNQCLLSRAIRERGDDVAVALARHRLNLIEVNQLTGSSRNPHPCEPP